MIFSAPSCLAERMASRSTAPSPTKATVLPPPDSVGDGGQPAGTVPFPKPGSTSDLTVASGRARSYADRIPIVMRVGYNG